jgi:hypothetical protein
MKLLVSAVRAADVHSFHKFSKRFSVYRGQERQYQFLQLLQLMIIVHESLVTVLQCIKDKKEKYHLLDRC